MVLLLEDYQFVHPAFLEMVNSLLSSGAYSVCCLFSLSSNSVGTDLTVSTSKGLQLLCRVTVRFWIRLMFVIKEMFDILGNTFIYHTDSDWSIKVFCGL